jgi:hypothetical protein
VRCAVYDSSGLEEKTGVRKYDIVSNQSPRKAFDAADPDQRAALADKLTEMAEVFIDDVATFRGVSAATVKSDYGKGDWLVGTSAVAAGLADEIGSLESILDGENMGKMNPGNGPKATMESETCDGCDASLGGSDKVYCAGCYGGDTEAKASGEFAATVMTALGASSKATALGALARTIEASKATAEAVARAEAAEGKMRTSSLVALVRSSVATQSLALGALSSGLRIALRGDAKAAWTKGVEAMTDQSLDAMTAVLEQLPLSADDFDAAKEYLSSTGGKVLAPMRVEPVRDARAEGEQLSGAAKIVADAAAKANAMIDRKKGIAQ